jgi:dihydropyrimidinase
MAHLPDNSEEFWIHDGAIVTGEGLCDADVLVRAGKIASVEPRGCSDRGNNGPDSASRGGIDAAGLWVLPGGVDAHVHFGMPLGRGIRSLGWRESSEAALLGGTTTVIDFANPERGESLASAVGRWLHAAGPECLCDYGLHVTVAEINAQRLAEIPRLIARGMPTFKGFLAYKGRLMLTVAEMEQLMRAVAKAGGRLLVHAEDGEMNAQAEAALLHTGRIGPEWHPAAHPPESEVRAVETALDSAVRCGCPLTLVHLSVAESLEKLRQAREKIRRPKDSQNLPALPPDFLTGEVCLHHLFASAGCCDGSYEANLRVVLSPPIRTVHDSAVLLKGLAIGDLDILSTDHCEFPLAVKMKAARGGFTAIPNGAGGVGERMTFAYAKAVATGNMPPERWVHVCCERPAELMGLAGRKGRLAPGYDADIVLLDPQAEYRWRPLGASDPASSLWAGLPCQGAVRTVLLRGRVVVEDGKLLDNCKEGEFIVRSL